MSSAAEAAYAPPFLPPASPVSPDAHRPLVRKNDHRGLNPTTMATSSTPTKNSSVSLITFAAVTPSITESPYHVPK